MITGTTEPDIPRIHAGEYFWHSESILIEVENFNKTL
jgi:hypothetical protein